MAKSGNATDFGIHEEDGPLDGMLYASNYAQDISEQMRVPKRIKATGEYSDDHESMWAATNGNSNAWNFQEKFDMTVPDRIVVIGQEQHHGTRSAPREIVLENSILKSPDRNSVRVSTPPRSIVLSQHHFPTASEQPSNSESSSTRMNDDDFSEMDDEQHGQTVIATDGPELRVQPVNKYLRRGTNNKFQSREGTPPLSQSMVDHLTPSEELQHLRKNVHSLRARLLTVEQEMSDRVQREKYLIALGIGYFLLKAIWWLKNN